MERVSCASCFPAISVTGGTGFGGSGLLLAKNSSSEMPETINNKSFKNISQQKKRRQIRKPNDALGLPVPATIWVQYT
jgi:hypothetical protein